MLAESWRTAVEMFMSGLTCQHDSVMLAWTAARHDAGLSALSPACRLLSVT